MPTHVTMPTAGTHVRVGGIVGSDGALRQELREKGGHPVEQSLIAGMEVGIAQDVLALSVQQSRLQDTRVSLFADYSAGMTTQAAAMADGSTLWAARPHVRVGAGAAVQKSDAEAFLRYRGEVFAGVDLAMSASPYVGGRVSVGDVWGPSGGRDVTSPGVDVYAQVDYGLAGCLSGDSRMVLGLGGTF